MDFKTLRYVVAIAEHQNLTKAAEALYVGQPTLSKFLTTLERELGLKLFQRLGNRYLPTYAGERYISRAVQILQMGEDLHAEMSDILKLDAGVLRVAFAPMRLSYLLPGVIPAFQLRYPNVRFSLLEGSSAENDQRLLDGQADLAFYSRPEELNPFIAYQTLGQEELLVCASPSHPLAQTAVPVPESPYRHLELSRLSDHRVLLLLPSQRTRQIVDSILEDQRIRLNDVLCTSNMQAIMGLVSEGYGVSMLFDSHLRYCLAKKPIECFRFGRQRVLCDFVAASRRGSYLPTYAQDFIEIVRNAL